MPSTSDKTARQRCAKLTMKHFLQRPDIPMLGQDSRTHVRRSDGDKALLINYQCKSFVSTLYPHQHSVRLVNYLWSGIHDVQTESWKIGQDKSWQVSSTPHWDRISNICITFKNNSITAIPGNHVSCTMQKHQQEFKTTFTTPWDCPLVMYKWDSCLHYRRGLTVRPSKFNTQV